MTSDDALYFRTRAIEQREAARNSTDSYIAKIHLELAETYEAIVKHAEQSGVRAITN